MTPNAWHIHQGHIGFQERRRMRAIRICQLGMILCQVGLWIPERTENNLGHLPPGQEHGISITEETITLVDGMAVGIHDFGVAGKGRDQHQ